MAVKDNTATGLLEGDLNDTEDHRRAVYALFKAGDERFDGRVFVGVSSTGVYCRPVCRVKMPKFENCTFYHSAAEAEAAAQPEAAAEAEATAVTMPRAPRCARPAWRLLRSPNPPRTALFVQNSQHRCEKVGE